MIFPPNGFPAKKKNSFPGKTTATDLLSSTWRANLKWKLTYQSIKVGKSLALIYIHPCGEVGDNVVLTLFFCGKGWSQIFKENSLREKNFSIFHGFLLISVTK
jgi:hypothetical protein